jgi:ABC-type phosphate/phosphonate transport system substrate-binding protein
LLLFFKKEALPLTFPSASLGMYDFPWLQPTTDRLWAAIRDALRAACVEAPERLDRERPLEAIWRDPKLVLAQACGLPLVTTLRDAVRVVATPCYDLPGCDGPHYRSFIVVAADHPARGIADLRGARAAINGWDSQSGMNALRALVAPLAGGQPFFSDIVVSGSHQRSLAMVGDGTADVAAIDCVTHGLLAAHGSGHLAGTRVLCHTPPVPGLPLITAAATPDATLNGLRAVLDAVIADPALEDIRATLHLRGIARLALDDYRPILASRADAEAAGYPQLR